MSEAEREADLAVAIESIDLAESLLGEDEDAPWERLDLDWSRQWARPCPRRRRNPWPRPRFHVQYAKVVLN